MFRGRGIGECQSRVLGTQKGKMIAHGGIDEICRTHQAPAGFVKLATGEVSTTTSQRASFRNEAHFIEQKKQKKSGWGKHFERIAVGSQIEELKLHNRKFDGDIHWSRNKDAIDYLKRAGHPIATQNPALLSSDSG